MIVYVDTSALLKLYLEEEHSEAVSRLTAGADRVAISVVGYAETRAGLAAGLRAGRLTADSYRETLATFEATWAGLSKIEVGDRLVRFAGDLAEQHNLRGFDAIHLASALSLHQELGEPVFFSAFDDRLVDAAVASGLSRP